MVDRTPGVGSGFPTLRPDSDLGRMWELFFLPCLLGRKPNILYVVDLLSTFLPEAGFGLGGIKTAEDVYHNFRHF